MLTLRLAVVLIMPLVLSVGCDSAGDEPLGLAASPTHAPTADPTADDDVVMLEALYGSYWEAFVDLSNDPRIEPEVFEGITTREFAQDEMSYIRAQLIDNDLRRVGEPELSNITVVVTGDEARIEACLDETEWTVLQGDEDREFDLGISASVRSAERGPDGWLISGIVSSDDARITC
jgi:hypothetical protein